MSKWTKCVGSHMKGGKMDMKDAAKVCKRKLHMNKRK